VGGENPRVLQLEPGRCLSPSDIAGAALGLVVVDPGEEALRLLGEARRVYLREASSRPVYGYCTGLGALLDRRAACGPGYEDRVLDEHAAGAGPEAPGWLVRSFMAVWLSQVSSGGHPLRPAVAVRVAEALRAGMTPVVPLYGSVGASGDLAPSAHAMRCLLRGKGEALLAGSRMPCREALARLGLEPLELEAGEALAAINNTAWSTALAGMAVWVSGRLLEASLRAAAYTLEAVGFNPEHYGEGCEAKRHPGQAMVSRRLRRLRPLVDSGRLQDPYSMRCIPQVYGAASELLDWAGSVVERESCSATANPTVWKGRVWHGCNFHSIYPGLAAEAATHALLLVANMTAFRIERLMESRINGVSDFLAGEGSSVGAMILQYTAASLAAEARSEAAPRITQWLSTSLGQEDANPMSPLAGLRALRLARIASWLVAIEAAAASLARRARGLGDPLGVNASLSDPSGSVARARRILLGVELVNLLDSLPG
jgi:histidine ammonia-lyase